MYVYDTEVNTSITSDESRASEKIYWMSRSGD